MLTNKLTGVGAAGDSKTYIEDVFSTYLYTGNGSSQTINNGIQLGDKLAGGSASFGGYLTTPSNADFDFGSGNFTIECWVCPTDSFVNWRRIISRRQNTGVVAPFDIWVDSTAAIYFSMSSNGSTWVFDTSFKTPAATLALNVWSHIAVVRNGSTFTIYINGTSAATATSSASLMPSSTNVSIGSLGGGEGPFVGNLSNVRLVKGAAVYTSNFTPSTAPITSVTGTVLLTCQGPNALVDNSGTGKTITNNGNVSTSDSGPFAIAGTGKGGMVWCKKRDFAQNNIIQDTARGTSVYVCSNNANGNLSITGAITSFNSNGFSVGPENLSNQDNKYVSWTFRKAPKFFDVVTYTGDGATAYQTLNHSLGQTPGMIIVKKTSGTQDWFVWHRSLGANQYAWLNATNAANTFSGVFGSHTSSTFQIGNVTNTNGATYVAYLFAHDTTTDGLIQCGSYTGNGSATGPSVTLGWEPQYLMIKNASGTGNWQIIDNMRGMPVGSSDATLQANLSNAESSVDYVSPTATGFQVTSTSTEVNTSGSTYIYMAIRRGPMRTPTDATKVLSVKTYNATISSASVTHDVVIDLEINKNRQALSPYLWVDRLRGLAGTSIQSEGNGIENTYPTYWSPRNQTEMYAPSAFDDWWASQSGNKSHSSIAFRRAPGFFDVVCYTGTGVARTVDHNLGVVPDLIITKSRSYSENWIVYTATLGNTKALVLNLNLSVITTSATWNTTSPTQSNFTLGESTAVNRSGTSYVAYLFASCPGVSKVGSYTGNGSSQTINCGFTNGARFVLIKRTDSTGDWYVWDTARGIVAATDPHLSLNSNAAEVTTDDTIDPDSTGFIVNQVTATDVNVSGGSYIYLAIA